MTFHLNGQWAVGKIWLITPTIPTVKTSCKISQVKAVVSLSSLWKGPNKHCWVSSTKKIVNFFCWAFDQHFRPYKFHFCFGKGSDNWVLGTNIECKTFPGMFSTMLYVDLFLKQKKVQRNENKTKKQNNRGSSWGPTYHIYYKYY